MKAGKKIHQEKQVEKSERKGEINGKPKHDSFAFSRQPQRFAVRVA